MTTADDCPTCGEPYAAQCRCLLRDRVCPNGHHWYQCRVCKVTVTGEADHADPKSGYCADCLAAGAAGGGGRVILWG
jgi:hypothetical protein